MYLMESKHQEITPTPDINESKPIDSSPVTLQVHGSPQCSTQAPEKNSQQIHVCILTKIRKTLVCLREKTNACLREKTNAIKDYWFLQYFWSPEQVESPRVYHVWPGNNVFFFEGRLICGPDPKGLLLTVSSITLSSCTFIVNVSSARDNPSVTIISSILTIIVLFNMGLVSTIDPGIIPRNERLCVDSGERRKSPKAMITINGVEMKVKYCSICNIYRSPRSCHCAVCDNCVEKFDHHCPWIGHCVGLRNYRFYLTFLVTSLAFFIYILVFSSEKIQQKWCGDGSRAIYLLRDCPETLALTIFCSVAVCFLGGLTYYHLHLIAINQTAYENFHQKFNGSRNPYNKGFLNNFKEVFISPHPPSKINFQADAIVLDDREAPPRYAGKSRLCHYCFNPTNMNICSSHL